MTSTEVTTSGTRSSNYTDIGLLVLRIALGATMLQAGLIKLLDFSKTAAFMEQGGWRLPQVGAFLVTAAETLGGIGLLLGILTPLAACAVLASMIDAWLVNVSAAAFWSEPFNVPFLVAVGAVTLIFTGAGADSVDAAVLRRSRWSSMVSLSLLALGVVAAIVTWIALNGTNPIHFTAPPTGGGVAAERQNLTG